MSIDEEDHMTIEDIKALWPSKTANVIKLGDLVVLFYQDSIHIATMDGEYHEVTVRPSRVYQLLTMEETRLLK
jgi:hypothetical protein